MKCTNAIKFHRKSGGAWWRDLQFHSPTSPSVLGTPSSLLEMESKLRRKCSRRDIVCPAKRRQKVIQRIFIAHIDSGNVQAPFVPVPGEQIIVPNRSVKKIPRRNPGGIVVIIPGARGRDAEQSRPILGSRARCRQWRSQTCLNIPARQPRFELLIGGQAAKVHRRLSIQQSRRRSARAVWIVGERVVARCRAGNHSAIKPPVEADPRAAMKGQLILHVGRLVEPFVVIDAERQSSPADRGAGSCNLRRKEPSRHRRHHHKR
jgi:hypothetical protein